jgi:hypothetical protein
MHKQPNGISFIKALLLGADARLSRVNFTDDQAWHVLWGDDKHAPLTLKTGYGGRVKHATITPQWSHEGRTIATPQTYYETPQLVAFAPAFARLQGKITHNLMLTAEYWVMESNAIGGRFTIQNIGTNVDEIRLSLVGDVLTDKKASLAILTLISEAHALSMGRYPRLEPVLMMEHGTAGAITSKEPIIHTSLKIEAGKTQTVRFVHAGLSRMSDSVERATYWLGQNWDEAFANIEQASQTIPHIQTGDPETDALIALSYHHLLQAVIPATNHLPHASFVATRHPDKGYSAKGDGSDYDRSWSGQSAHLAYLMALGLAPISSELAQGILHNFLATQTDDGKVDMKPSFASSRSDDDYLCPPILARLTWNIYQFTEDRAFLEATFPKLLRFYQRWLEEDVDKDSMPEWADERQMGYVFFPTFGNNQAWAQNVDIRVTESPDMAAYMISEAIHLSYISHLLGKTDGYGILNKLHKHQAYLDKLWRDDIGRYSYQDRDSNLATPYIPIFIEQAGDERVPVALSLEDPARIQVHLIGGTNHPPKATLHIIGIAPNGDKIHEQADVKTQFRWGYGNGFYTSQHLFQTINELYFEGVSRVYKVNAHTVDFTRPDVNTLMPLMLNGIPENRAESLIKLLTDPAQFWRPSGMSIVSAKDHNYDPASAIGGGGTWAYWTTLIGEGLIEYGRGDIARDMLKRLIKTQIIAYQQNGYFSEFYHSDQAQGCGEKHHVGGIIPVYLLQRLVGIQIFDGRRVFIGGKQVWNEPITMSQHGVTIQRTGDQATITFASGHHTTLTVKDDGEIITDPTADTAIPATFKSYFPPQLDAPNDPKRVIIQVDIEADDVTE